MVNYGKYYRKKTMDLHLFSDSLSKNNTSLFFSKEKTDFLIQQIIYIFHWHDFFLVLEKTPSWSYPTGSFNPPKNH
jgi:hypothetical protein